MRATKSRDDIKEWMSSKLSFSNATVSGFVDNLAARSQIIAAAAGQRDGPLTPHDYAKKLIEESKTLDIGVLYGANALLKTNR
jgi:hypothetical protein